MAFQLKKEVDPTVNRATTRGRVIGEKIYDAITKPIGGRPYDPKTQHLVVGPVNAQRTKFVNEDTHEITTKAGATAKRVGGVFKRDPAPATEQPKNNLKDKNGLLPMFPVGNAEEQTSTEAESAPAEGETEVLPSPEVEKMQAVATGIKKNREAMAEETWADFRAKWVTQAVILAVVSIAFGGLPLTAYVWSLGVMPFVTPAIRKGLERIMGRGVLSNLATIVVGATVGGLSGAAINYGIENVYPSLYSDVTTLWNDSNIESLPGRAYHAITTGEIFPSDITQTTHAPTTLDIGAPAEVAKHHYYPGVDSHPVTPDAAPAPAEVPTTQPAPAEVPQASAHPTPTAPAEAVNVPQEAPGVQEAIEIPTTGVPEFDIIGNPTVEDVMREYSPENMLAEGISPEKVEMWGKLHDLLIANREALNIGDTPPNVRLSDFFGTTAPDIG